MLKVLIVDDEVKLIQLVKYLVDWKAFHMEIADTATNGEEALDAIISLHPDVVITDIRMPGLDGIELIRRSHEAGFHPFFIIMSGYGDFEYAQKAIQLGVEDYLLKPLKKKELEQVLGKINEKHNLTVSDRAEKQALEEKLENSSSHSKSALLTQLLSSGIGSSDTDIRNTIFADYGIQFRGDYFLIIVTHIFTETVEETEMNREMYGFVLPKLQETIGTRVSGLCSEYAGTIYHREIVSLLNYSDGGDGRSRYADIISALRRVRINMLNYQNIYPKMKVSVGVSLPFQNLAKAAFSFDQARRAVSLRFADPDEFILDAADMRAIDPNSADKFISSETRQNILNKIDLLDADGLYNILKGIQEKLSPRRRDGNLIRSCYDALIDTFLYGIKSFDSESVKDADRDYFQKGFDCLYSFEEIFDWLSNTCRRILQGCADEQKNLEDKPIRDAKQYIQDNYNQAITLDSVSKAVGFNPAYFSTMFKKATGQNFTDYLKDVRIEKAKSLLLHTNSSVADIAKEVGYTDIKYFSRLFRKLTNLTPSEFRSLYN